MSPREDLPTADITTRTGGGPLCPPAPVLRPGSRIQGRYEIFEPIGAGAFSTVYRARDPVLRREVALKVYHPGVRPYISQQEATLQAQVQHPHLMALFDAGTDPLRGQEFAVMPLYPGSDLQRDLVAHERTSVKRTLVCAEQICSALEVLWRRRHAIHGDIKPANIWMTPEGSAVLMDFNLRGLLVAGTGTTAGTPGYTAPEVMAGRRDPRSDVFSLGCVVYRMLTGRLPFAVGSPISGRPLPPSHFRPDVGTMLDDLVLTALSPDPDDRFPDATALRTAIRCTRYGVHPLVASFRRMLSTTSRPALVTAVLTVIAVVATLGVACGTSLPAGSILIGCWVLAVACGTGASAWKAADWEACYLATCSPGTRAWGPVAVIAPPAGMCLVFLWLLHFTHGVPPRAHLVFPVLVAAWGMALPSACHARPRFLSGVKAGGRCLAGVLVACVLPACGVSGLASAVGASLALAGVLGTTAGVSCAFVAVAFACGPMPFWAALMHALATASASALAGHPGAFRGPRILLAATLPFILHAVYAHPGASLAPMVRYELSHVDACVLQAVALAAAPFLLRVRWRSWPRRRR